MIGARQFSLRQMLIVVSVLCMVLLMSTMTPRSTRTPTPTFKCEEKRTIKPRHLVFARDSLAFVDAFVDCIRDENCHIFYHHVQKTGGSYVAARLYPILNGKSYDGSQWCCHEGFMSRFQQNIPKFCSLKLGIYEVHGSQFEQVVATCMDHHHQQKALSDNNTTNDSRCSSSSIHQMPVRFLALASIREPIQRTLSMIHQVCNKNFNGLPSEEKAICKRCSYSGDDKVYWDDHCLKTNQAYANLTYRIPSADLLIIDSMFLDKFFAMVEAALEQKIPMKDVRVNVESTNICSFSLISSMLRLLAPSHSIYKNLSIGLPVYP